MALSLLAGGCSKDDADGMATDGNRVVFTLGGSTRAAGDNDTHSSLASTAEEKQIDNLIAVAFTTDGNYYKSFETEYDALQNTATFDLEKNGTYDIYFVANADETLSESLMTLTDQTADTQVTADDLSKLVVTQAVGKKDGVEEWHPFVMLSDGAKRVVSQHGSVTNGGLIMMRRLAVRFDLVNAADGVTITSVKFVNRVKESLLAAANDMSFADAGTLYEDKTYADVNLAGSFADPKSYVATIYSYENVNTGAEHLPALEITYTMDGYTLTHTVKFYDSTDESGTKPLALKRNYLYRIVLTKPLNVEFDITVEDWNTADAFQITDLPFEKTDQATLNSRLKVNMFTTNYVKDIDLENREIKSFYDEDYVFSVEDKSNYKSWEELDSYDGIWTAEFTGPDGIKYRFPTAGELGLLVPADIRNVTARNHPYWNLNPETNSGYYMNTEPFMETLYLKNQSNRYQDTSHSDEVDGAYTLKGESQLKIGEKTSSDLRNGKNYDVYAVYGLRFKGTSQYAAYRWEYQKVAEDPSKWKMLFRIKALKQNDITTTIDDIVRPDFWKEGSYIEIGLPCSGYWSSTSGTGISTSGYIVSNTVSGVDNNFHNVFCEIESIYSTIKPNEGFLYKNQFPLLLVKVSEE